MFRLPARETAEEKQQKLVTRDTDVDYLRKVENLRHCLRYVEDPASVAAHDEKESIGRLFF